MIFLRVLLCSLILSFTATSLGQTDTLTGIPKLRELINQKQIADAKKELASQIANFKATEKFDTLPYYVEFVGSYTLANNNWDLALAQAEAFVDTLISYNNAGISKQALKELAWIYDETGKPDKAYQTVREALTYARKEKNVKGSTVADITYNLGYYSGAMGEYQQAKNHYLDALKLVNANPNPDQIFLQQIYNSLGGVMWMQGKMDSCNYYFKQSVIALKKTDSSAMNRYFRPGLLKMNMAVVSNVLGKNNEAIQFSEEAINNFNTYVRISKDEQRKNAAKGHTLVAIDNLGVFYNTIGEFSRAEDLIIYALEQKKKNKTHDDPNVIISQIILAQAKMNTRKLDEAAQLLDKSIEQLNNTTGVQDNWRAAAYSTRAKIFEENKQFEEAAIYYKKAETMYRIEKQGDFNNDVLTEFATMALFYAKRGNESKAIELGKEAYEYTKRSVWKNTLQAQINTLSLAEVYFELGDFEQAIKYSDEAIDFRLHSAEKAKSVQDSVLAQFSKPRAYLIKAKALYEKNKPLSETELTELLNLLNNGIAILEQRKTVIKTYDDVSKLISSNEELFNFAKKIRLDHYLQTEQKQSLDEILSLHESAIYSRIRARLNLRQDIQYANVPKSVIEREQLLKNNLSNSLKSETPDGIDQFFSATQNWNQFIDSLRTTYPKYYDIRYKNIETSLTSIQQSLPKNTSAIRYLFVDSKLYAIVLDKTQKTLIPLDFNAIENSLPTIHNNPFSIQKMGPELYKLYDVLWKPLEGHIKHTNVIIIPDGALYNLSFEMLTHKPIETWGDLAESSLLGRYTISYNFSLLLLNSDTTSTTYAHNYVAFAPEFTSEMKNEYQLAVTDSVQLDKTYLTLLPQPFTSEIAKKYATVFNGDAFLNKNASKQFFMKNSGEHKIIHIGTHAESNNVMPELSRLIFAKSVSNDTLLNNNSLYTYEIYNQNLTSELAILTACDTGKPTYQAGEGMISLAHAFRYAGSKSILTSLWQIDEQSSAQIVSAFYDYLKEGKAKDEALRLAKLDYLATANGRTAAPSYWAGLVLIGDTTAIEIDSDSVSWGWYLTVGLLVIALSIIFFLLRKK
tara:strand:+ start:113184 stop:116417 length:3234 start_codon:yes stop_codon:yes gene_type:complete